MNYRVLMAMILAGAVVCLITPKPADAQHRTLGGGLLGAGIGGAIGGKSGAVAGGLIGAGAGMAREPGTNSSPGRSGLAGGLLGAGIGKAVGGSKGALIGGATGAGAGLIRGSRRRR